ncbi:hypothetical protein RQP46_011469 [Phenoliferia psychrophenolica]
MRNGAEEGLRTGYETAKEGRSSAEGTTTATEDDDDEDDDDQLDGDLESEETKTQNVVVCLRVRPTRSTSTSPSIYAFSPLHSSLALTPHHPTFLKRGAAPLSARKDEYEFKFDKLLLEGARTDELYDAKIRGVVRAAMSGFNGTVFAYGQTASGKSHTMMGNDDEPGVIPLAIEELFDFIHKQNDKRTFTLRVSFLEIYNEAFRDLLAPSSHSATLPSTSTTLPTSTSLPKLAQPKLDVAGDDGTVRGLEEHPVSTPEEVLQLLAEGEQGRRTGATDWNERSSRSHVVFMVTIESVSKVDDGVARTSRLNLIDLAGSESATGQTERLKEGSFINRSLLTLGTVIAKLTESRNPSAPAPHIPYRDSKLTRLLQPALSGNSRVAVICTISPDVAQASETLSTLKFARRAKMVVTKAERGVLVSDQAALKEYASQVERLQRQIREQEDAMGEGELARERDRARAEVDALQSRSKVAESELAAKELELERLRAQLATTQSFILTGASVEANALRSSSSNSLFTPRAKRIASEMSALGIGTPSRTPSSRMLTRVASSSIAVEGSGRVGSVQRETELEKALEAAERKLATLTSTTESLRSEIQSLTDSSTLTSSALATAEASLTSARAELASLSSLSSKLTELEHTSSSSHSSLTHQLSLTHAKTAKLESQLAQLTSSSNDREDRIRQLKAELAFAKRELAAVTALHQRCPAEREDLKHERDLARQQAADAQAAVADVEEVAALEVQRHVVEESRGREDRLELASQLAMLEKAMQEETARADELQQERDAQRDEIARLRRQVDSAKELEAQRKTYAQNQRVGTDSLKSRLADLQARSATPTPGAPLNRSTSSTSSASAGKNIEKVVELEVRNEELSSRVGELERALRLAEKRPAPVAQTSSDGWREERKTRRETIDRDLHKLRGVVERSKTLLDSPGTSPTKAAFENLQPPPPTPRTASARKGTGPLRSSHTSGTLSPLPPLSPKKSSTDMGRYWS